MPRACSRRLAAGALLCDGALGALGALRVCIETAQELVRQARRRYAGAYLMPSFGRVEVVAEVLDGAV